MIDIAIRGGLLLAEKYNVATACIEPYSIPLAEESSEVRTWVSAQSSASPPENSTTSIKCTEADEACKTIGPDFKVGIDMVVNVGKVLGGD